jgi:hypothetical protein
MKEVTEEAIGQVVGKIFRDTLVYQSPNYFIKHVYTADQFVEIIDPTTFHSIIGFLPNTKYRGTPFIMSVAYNKKQKNYEITVHNPKLKY